MDAVIPFLIAILLAVFLAYIELETRLKFRPRRRGLTWWGLRLFLEASIAVGGVLIIQYLAKDQPAADFVKTGIGLGIAGGIAGPAVMRSRVFTIGKGVGAQEVGLALLFNPIRDWLESRIDNVGSLEQTIWIQTVVFPKITTEEALKGLASWFLVWFSGRQFSDQQKADERRFVTQLLADTSSVHDKTESLVERILGYGGRGLVDALLSNLPTTQPVPVPAAPAPPPVPPPA